MLINNKSDKLLKLKEDFLPLGFIAVLVLVFLHKGLFPLNESQCLSSDLTDTHSYFYPVLSIGSRMLAQGTIPLWNPYIYSGTPYIATFQTAVFYPVNLLYNVFPLSIAVNWSIAINLYLSGVFTFYLLKNYGNSRFGSTTGGIIYMFSAPLIMHIYAGHLVLIAAITWTPLMFLLVDRFFRFNYYKYGPLLSITMAVQLFSGYPQDFFYTMIAISLNFIFLLVQTRNDKDRKIGQKVIAFAAFILLGLALSAVQILPTIELTRYSTRESLSYEWVSIFSFPPENLITFLIPDFFGNMLKTPYWGKNYLWEMTAYVGIVPLLLAITAVFCARRKIVWFFAGLACVSIVQALGKYTPILKILYSYVPGFNLFRGSSKWIFLNALSLAVLSGFGADALIKPADSLKKKFKTLTMVSCIMLAGMLVVIYSLLDVDLFRRALVNAINSGDFFNDPAPVMLRSFETVAIRSVYNGIGWSFVLLVTGSSMLLLYSYGKLKEKAFMVVVTAIIVFDLFAFGMRYMVTFDSRRIRWDKDIVDFLRQDKEPFRVIAPEMDVNSGMASGIETLGGYDTIILKRYGEFINLSQGLPPDKPNLWMDIKSVNKLTDLLNARYLVLQSGSSVNNPAFRSVFDNGRYRVYQNMNALPRAFVVHDAKVINDRDNIFRELMRPDFNPASYVVLEEEPHNPINRLASRSPIPRFIEHSPNKVMVEAYLTEPGLLVLGDVYYPGWKAFVDGKEAKIYRANYIMRAVVLPEGRHVVEFRYDPLSFKLGAIISLASLAFVTGFLIWDWRKNENIKGSAQ